MFRKIVSLILVTFFIVSLMSGCKTAGSVGSETARLRQEISNVKQELQTRQDELTAVRNELDASKKQYEELNTRFETVSKDLETHSNSLVESQQQLLTVKANYELRNQLDALLYKVIDLLIIGDVASAKKNFVKGVKISNGVLTTYPEGNSVTFDIPDIKMNLRQRSFELKTDSFSAIYEIYDAGYTTEPQYNERTYTLNVSYKKESDKWKIKGIFIDE